MAEITLERRYEGIYYLKAGNIDLYEWQLQHKSFGDRWYVRNPVMHIPKLYNPQANEYNAECTLSLRSVLRTLTGLGIPWQGLMDDLWQNYGWGNQITKVLCEEEFNG